jgi:hypothetical protein
LEQLDTLVQLAKQHPFAALVAVELVHRASMVVDFATWLLKHLKNELRVLLHALHRFWHELTHWEAPPEAEAPPRPAESSALAAKPNSRMYLVWRGLCRHKARLRHSQLAIPGVAVATSRAERPIV